MVPYRTVPYCYHTDTIFAKKLHLKLGIEVILRTLFSKYLNDFLNLVTRFHFPVVGGKLVINTFLLLIKGVSRKELLIKIFSEGWRNRLTLSGCELDELFHRAELKRTKRLTCLRQSA